MTEKLWRYGIQHGSEGEANYAWVYRGQDMIATMKTHIAKEICDRMNAPDPAVNVGTVKALEWVLNRGFAAETPFGLYEVEPHGAVWHMLHAGGFVSLHSTEDEAQSAAQADYERRILSALSTPPHEAGSPAPSTDVVGSELLTTIKEFARWHHLNEMTIAAGKTPSDSEIDFEAIAWNRITRALAATEGSAE
ncbi:hypothetical protein G8E10_09380 [Rhizobiaceae bacterium CRRU44]|uniref:Uncharacterized protein n=1 Tax=Ferranicluibacter rubi TaxID=2715133 RepID=A0AA44CAA4_9HYPH|nr:hypothetical protein [Ferranicluibacter rubi]NHT75890.1 hypothetical protein [Ferranicluibacter rubi]NHT75950.1 hypothetical protein [Ferranicluibacter rubi]